MNGCLEEVPMLANSSVRWILQSLRKCIDAADRIDAWRDEHKEDIASSRAELGLSTEQTADHRKFVVTDVERSLDPLGLTKEIKTVAANLGKASFRRLLISLRLSPPRETRLVVMTKYRWTHSGN